MSDAETFDQYCIVELLGHRRLAGRVREVQIAGAGFLRLDIPAAGADPARTTFVSPASVYALHPVDEQTARAAATAFRPVPVERWELPAAPRPAGLERDLEMFAQRLENTDCDHDRQKVADPTCAGCIAHSVRLLAGRYGLDPEEEDNDGPF